MGRCGNGSECACKNTTETATPPAAEAEAEAAEAAAAAAVCVRCRKATPAVYFRDTGYCVPCATRAFEYKAKLGFDYARGAVFSAHIDAHPAPAAADREQDVEGRIALGLSGGQASLALLHAAAAYFRPRRGEACRLVLLHVDHGCGAEDAEAQRQAERFGLALTRVPLDAGPALFDAIMPPDTPRAQRPDRRSRAEDMRRILVLHALQAAAAEHGCAALMLGDTATRLAIRLIHGLAVGAGFKLPVLTADAMWLGPARAPVLVVRPLASILQQEVAYYAQTHGLHTNDEAEAEAEAGAEVDPKSSLGALTAHFIQSLDVSAASTINRTGAKLVRPAPREAPIPPHPPRIGTRAIRLAEAARALPSWSGGCPLCNCPASKHTRKWKETVALPIPDTPLTNALCYSCLAIVDGVPNHLLPSHVHANLNTPATPSSLQHMREAISDFLLE